MSEWISVKDRMPEDLQDVIVFSKGNEPACAYMRSGTWRASGVYASYDGCCGVELDGDPSHWHEVPELPL